MNAFRLFELQTIKSFLPDMIAKEKGHIVNIASMAGLNGINRLVDYCSSKFAVVGLTESLDIELKVSRHLFSSSLIHSLIAYKLEFGGYIWIWFWSTVNLPHRNSKITFTRYPYELQFISSQHLKKIPR